MNRSSLGNIALTVLCAFVLVGSASAAGSGGFRIEDYIPEKFTDLEWRLDGSLNLNGTNQDEERRTPTSSYIVSYENATDNQYNQLSLSSSIEYRHETVPRTLVLRSGLSGTFYRKTRESTIERMYSLSGSDNYERESEEHTISIGWSPSLEFNSYLTGDLFAGVTADASFYYSNTPKNDATTFIDNERLLGEYKRYYLNYQSDDQTANKKEGAVSLTIGPGWGRVYEGQYAATALYMVDELRKGGVLESDPSKDEMLQLTEVIYQNRMAHEVDHRLAKMDALNAVTEYLTDIGAIAEAGNFSYVLIQDVWDFFPHSSRRFGTQVKVGTGWEYNYSKTHQSRDDYRSRLIYEHHVDSANILDTLVNENSTYNTSHTSRSEFDNVFVTISARHYRPVSMRLQWDGFAELYYYVHAEGLRGRYHSSPGPRYGRPPGIQLQSAPGIDNYYQFHLGSYGTYIYSSRTNLQIYGVLTYDHYEMPTESGSERTRTTKSWDGTLGSTLTYRMSIPTALKVSTYYRNRGEQNTYQPGYSSDTGSWSFSASISHYLF
jgi:hypothetical protein